jgi:hypothetical protein
VHNVGYFYYVVTIVSVEPVVARFRVEEEAAGSSRTTLATLKPQGGHIIH